MNSISKEFNNFIKIEGCSEGIAAVKTLRKVIKHSSAGTIQEYQKLLIEATDELTKTDYPVAPIKSASELFLRYITFSKLDTSNFEECKTVLLHRADKFVDKILKSSDVIGKSCGGILGQYRHILVSGGSSVVWKSLLAFVAANKNRGIQLYLLESTATCTNYLLELSKLSKNVNIINITHQSVSYFMETVEVALFGAEAVVGSGGIINELGTLNVAIICKTFDVPFYVCTESFKFTTFFPLSQRDIPAVFRFRAIGGGDKKGGYPSLPSADYVPPEYISLFITDLGLIHPTSVSEELIKLYL